MRLTAVPSGTVKRLDAKFRKVRDEIVQLRPKASNMLGFEVTPGFPPNGKERHITFLKGIQIVGFRDSTWIPSEWKGTAHYVF